VLHCNFTVSTKPYSSLAAASEKRVYLKTLQAHSKLLGCKIKSFRIQTTRTPKKTAPQKSSGFAEGLANQAQHGFGRGEALPRFITFSVCNYENKVGVCLVFG